MSYQLRRLAGYLLGFVLFYAPFAVFQKIIGYFLNGKWQEQTIHSLCLRIPTEHLLDGKIFQYASISVVSLGILLVVAFFFGPIFCGRLCPAGAFTEYLSKLVPERIKIDWSKYTEIAPIRYGMLAGFCLVPFFGGILACAYCNFFLFDLLANYYSRGYFISLSSSLILTSILWLVIFGLFTKGGRGYCHFLCPVGAVQNLVHYFSSKLPFVYKMQVDRQKCIGCKKCVHSCPMQAVTLVNKKAEIFLHNCILCGQCAYSGPVQAIHYGRERREK